MIIECKNCNTKYRVDDSEIGVNGRMVYCSQCEYEWLYIPDPSNITRKKNYELPNLKIPKGRTTKWGYITIYALFICTSLFCFFFFEREFLINQHHLFEKMYRLFDYHSTEGLIVEVLEPVKKVYGDKDHSEIKYKIPIKIINNSDKTKFVQVIKIVGYDKKRNNILNISTNLRRDILPKSEFSMTICPNKEISDIDYIFVKIGNHHDLKNFKHKH